MKRYERGNVTLRDVWDVVRESAERRLGRRLLKAYLLLLAIGVLVVAGSALVGAVE